MTIRTSAFFAFIAAVSFGALVSPKAAVATDNPLSLYGRGIDFVVKRNGSPIGRHTTRFRKKGGKIHVTSNMKLEVKVLGFTAYSMVYGSRETWNGSGLERLRVNVNDDGEKLKISGGAKGGKFSWSANGKWRATKRDVFPTNHWNSRVVRQNRVLNTLTGKWNKVRIRRAGTESLVCRGRRIKATRYVYSGDLATEAWYDRAGRWVGLRFKAKDGSTIRFYCA